MSEFAGLLGLWEDIRNYLVVSTEVAEEAPIKSDLPLIITFKVTNVAQSEPDRPDIIFEEVTLKVGVPPDWTYERTTNLTGGQSFEYRHRCNYSQLTKVQYNIEAKLSLRSLLQVRQGQRTVSATRATLTVESYVGFLKEANIYRWAGEVIKKVTVPGPSTTLANLDAQKALLNKTMQEIQETGNNLQGIILFITKNERILQHKKMVDEYFRRAKEGLGRLHRLFSTPASGREIARERDSITTELTTDAARLNQATEELIRKN